MQSESAMAARPTEKDLAELSAEFDRFSSQRDDASKSRDRLNYDTRHCIWPNQSADGRKWAGGANGKVWPWPGAADHRVKLADKLIREDAAMLMVAWSRMRINAMPQEANDAEWASRATSLLKWMKFSQMTESRREAELTANWMLERGKCVMKVCWQREQQLERVEVDLEDVKATAMQAIAMVRQLAEADQPVPPELAQQAELPDLILNPDREKEAVDAAGEFAPHLDANRRRRVIRDLREKGVATFPRPYLVVDRPMLTALPLNEEIYIPPECSDLEQASAIYQRELLTETALRDRERSHGYDRKWVEHVAEKLKGQQTNLTDSLQTRTRVRRGMSLWNEQGTENLFEVIHCWSRRHDEDGVPGIYYTVFSPGYGEMAAYHDLLNYDHGRYPFVMFQREYLSRRAEDSRGYGEVAVTAQNAVKVQWDARTDRTTLATVPPMYYPEGEEPNEWGPGARFGTSRPDEFGYMDIPRWDVGSKEIELTVRTFEEEYFGRMNERGDNIVQATALRQQMADNWMAGWRSVDTQILQLCQQFLPDNTFVRLTGSNRQGQNLRVSREEIQGKFDLEIGYTIENLIPEVVKEKIGLMRDTLQIDRNGRVDPDAVIEASFDLVDPSLGDRVMKPGKDASSQMRKQVRDDVLQMFAGNEVDYVENDPSAAGKLDYLNEIFAGNAKYQEAYQQDERFKDLMDNYFKNLMHSVEQLGANAFAGRAGVKKVGS